MSELRGEMIARCMNSNMYCENGLVILVAIVEYEIGNYSLYLLKIIIP